MDLVTALVLLLSLVFQCFKVKDQVMLQEVPSWCLCHSTRIQKHAVHLTAQERVQAQVREIKNSEKFMY